MKTSQTRIGILGAGPAGLGAALGLARRGFSPILVERSGSVGGNAASFDLAGIKVDLGSHRLHPATDPEILSLLRSLLGPDLLERPRNGRILLKGRWIRFPLRPLDLLLRADRAFMTGVILDMAGRRVRGQGAPDLREETFASLLQRGLGRTICQAFYFPYARKIWGLDPEEISPDQAVKRVSARSMAGLLRRLLPGGSGPGGQRSRGRFFYPREGFGQISQALWEAASEAGAETRLGSTVKRVRLAEGGVEVVMEEDGQARTVSFHHLWSTIPVGALVRLTDPPPPPDVLRSADSLQHRAMILVYLVLAQDRVTEFDAHYVPGLEVPFTRVSEPKNYSGATEPRGRTVLCAEIPCAVGDGTWAMPPSELGEIVGNGLQAIGMPVGEAVVDIRVRRIPSAYPIYSLGYETHLKRIEEWVEALPRVVSFGRQGLFAHDNTHHALFSALSAVRCMGDDGRFDEERWAGFRKVFATHVVED